MATLKLILHPINKDAAGKRKIVLRLTSFRTKYFIDMGISVRIFADEFINGQIKPTAGIKEYKQINAWLKQREADAHQVLLKMEQKRQPITIESFKRQFFQVKDQNYVFAFFDGIIEKLEKNGKLGNASVYSTVKNSLQSFKNIPSLRFSDIDLRFLENYEAYLHKKGLKGTGKSLYMRTLRSAYNRAIAKEITDPSFYPFRNREYPRGYKISDLETATIKRALARDQIRKIETFETKPLTALHDAKCYFLFSFFTRGMNFTDMAALKAENISNNRINYLRAKTRYKQKFSILILPPVKDILEYFETHPEKGNYLLPILNDTVYRTPQQKRTRIQTVLKQCNRKLKLLNKPLEIDTPITTYCARHSWATILKREGVPIAAISEGMGHETEETTTIYLGSFDNDVLDDYDKLLLYTKKEERPAADQDPDLSELK